MSDRKIGILMALCTALMWGVLAIALKVALNYASSSTIVWFRFCFALVVLSLILAKSSLAQLKILKKPPPVLVFSGLCLAGNYFGYMKAVEYTSPSHAQILIQIAPLTVLICSLILFGERFSWRQFVGLIIAIAGFFIFFREEWQRQTDTITNYLSGDLWLSFAMITWVLYALIQKKYSLRWKPQQMNLVIYAVSTIVLLPTANFQEMLTWTTPIWLLMIYLGFNTLFAYGALAEAMKRLPASQVTVIIAANPLITVGAMTSLAALEVSWIAAEEITALGYIGGAIALVGVVLAIYQDKKKTKP